MSEEITVTKEFIEKLEVLLKVLDNPLVDDENIDKMISYFKENVKTELEQYKIISKINKDIETDYQDITRFCNDKGEVYYGLPDNKFIKDSPWEVEDVNNSMTWFKRKSEYEESLEKVHNSSFDDLIKFIQPDYPHNCSDCVYFASSDNCYNNEFKCNLSEYGKTGVNGLEKACDDLCLKNDLAEFLRKCLKVYDISDDDFEVLKKYVELYDNNEDYDYWWNEE